MFTPKIDLEIDHHPKIDLEIDTPQIDLEIDYYPKNRFRNWLLHQKLI